MYETIDSILPRKRGDKFAELWTHADGVIGHFKIGKIGRGDLSLLPNALHFVVVEAKIFSGLSKGTTNANYYHQAARYVACIAETIKRSHLSPASFSFLGFYLIAPDSQIKKRVFDSKMNRDSIYEPVKQRVDDYNEPKDSWFLNWFVPTIENINLKILSWENIIQYIMERDKESGNELKVFYEQCLQFNKSKMINKHHKKQFK